MEPDTQALDDDFARILHRGSRGRMIIGGVGGRVLHSVDVASGECQLPEPCPALDLALSLPGLVPTMVSFADEKNDRPATSRVLAASSFVVPRHPPSELAARGETAASHRGLAGRRQLEFHHGLLGGAAE
jgi:hypothetical protein